MQKNKILLVDDELNLTETISELLIHNNYDVKCAANGQVALEILNHWIPDIIISDIMMPIMDGYKFQEIVNESKLLNQIPFIFLTAKNDVDEIEKCSLRGIDYFITKPFKTDDLIKIIQVKIERFEKIKDTYNTLNFSYESGFIAEINRPLYGILGTIDHLIESKNNLEQNEIDLFYNSIKTSAKKLNRAIKNSTLYQNLKNNKLEFDDNFHTEISNCFFNIKDEITNTDEKQANRIFSSIDHSNIKIKEDYLQFILFELTDNALKFSKKSKKIIITGKKYNEEYYELKIEDFGIGFSDDELKKIDVNQPFKHDRTKQEGIGLGLFISKILTIKAGGVFTIISQKKFGTMIKLFFPLHIKKQ
ncbi:response regulator [Flavobacterium sp.]|uniref:ATP-binding response regulator n=1 Tax=Flavobacterium sp. TaxID=239 RepID=UPI0038FC3C36